MDRIKWGNRKDYLEIKRQMRIEIIREIQETVGCKNCSKFKRITEKDLLYKEKPR
ncbi:hypothetical protein [Maledivibacter halophilus]|uniref:Uncharacterized protein n=1 Tax=Maledivibacter halophilus TaxID=36842 RepID=A0A1T5KF59_9FIRM|nr:hypothetical protein [Maledivibacter halophilus]SKC62307.1 hypothetical protein SAMN02194393_01747 [Maledivibacter halophilus]